MTIMQDMKSLWYLVLQYHSPGIIKYILCCTSIYNTLEVLGKPDVCFYMADVSVITILEALVNKPYLGTGFLIDIVPVRVTGGITVEGDVSFARQYEISCIPGLYFVVYFSFHRR